MLKEEEKTWLILFNDLLLTLIEEVLFSFNRKDLSFSALEVQHNGCDSPDVNCFKLPDYSFLNQNILAQQLWNL